MDDRTVVDQAKVPVDTVTVEQAIFTSIRSPMGQGYRLVAASRGITAAEKREIVRCAPSHGSLCDPSPTGSGLASYDLQTGRHCVFLSQNAGAEQSARGGCRIYTHVLTLDPASYRRFESNPLRVQAAAQFAISPDLVRRPPTRLEPLPLSTNPASAVNRRLRAASTLTASDAQHVACILSAVLSERRVLVIGAPTSAEMLGTLLAATPAVVRQGLPLSYGLKFSPTRRFQLIFAEADRNETRRVTRDQDIELYHWGSPPPPASSPFGAWLRFARRHWEAGRTHELDQLSVELREERSADVLEQITALCSDLHQVLDAEVDLLDQLVQKHYRTTPQGETHGRLLAQFHKAAESRRADLARAEAESSEQEQTETLARKASVA